MDHGKRLLRARKEVRAQAFCESRRRAELGLGRPRGLEDLEHSQNPWTGELGQTHEPIGRVETSQLDEIVSREALDHRVEIGPKFRTGPALHEHGFQRISADLAERYAREASR